jgi:hypothetical protein
MAENAHIDRCAQALKKRPEGLNWKAEIGLPSVENYVVTIRGE